MTPLDTLDRPPTVRVKLLSTQFLSEFYAEYGGRLPEGTVLDVDQDTARRWIEKAMIAELAPDEQTERENRRSAALAELARLDALENGEQSDPDDDAKAERRKPGPKPARTDASAFGEPR